MQNTRTKEFIKLLELVEKVKETAYNLYKETYRVNYTEEEMESFTIHRSFSEVRDFISKTMGEYIAENNPKYTDTDAQPQVIEYSKKEIANQIRSKVVELNALLYEATIKNDLSIIIEDRLERSVYKPRYFEQRIKVRLYETIVY